MLLENEEFIISFDALGGEISSVVSKELDIEYMYKGNTEFWGGKNPTLFPIVGNTFSKTYEVNGETYAMKNHGLIRYAKLNGTYQNGRVEFTYCSNEETLSVYPFHFSYKMIYELDGSTLIVSYEIENTGPTKMPFTFGLHPGFLCPLQADETFEDYTFHFEKEEHCQQFDFQTLEYKELSVKEVSLNYKLFETQPTLIYEGVESEVFRLQGKRHGVQISVAGNQKHYPILALWTPKEGAPFICVEPWLASGDLKENDKDFFEREGTIVLEEKERFETSYRISFF